MSHQIPMSWWRAAQVALWIIIGIGIMGAVALAAGAANPPKAGSRVVQIPAGTTEIALPDPPYTLELAGTLPADSDPLAAWGATLTGSSTILRVQVNGFGFFSVTPGQPDFTPFIHLRPAGKLNTIRLDVEPTWETILRLNDEIAWRGKIAAVQRAKLIRVPRFDLTQFTMYSP